MASAGLDRDGLVSLTELRKYIRDRINSERQVDSSIQQTSQWSDLLGLSRGEFFFVSSELRKGTFIASPSVATGLQTKAGVQPVVSLGELLRQEGQLDVKRAQASSLAQNLGLSRFRFYGERSGQANRELRQLEAEIESLGRSLVQDLMLFLMEERWLLEDNPDEAELAVRRMVAVEKYWVARSYAERHGDYRQAVEFARSALAYEPQNSMFQSMLEEWQTYQHLSEERFYLVREGMTREEVVQVAGRANTKYVRFVAATDTLVWLYPRSESCVTAAAIYFRMSGGDWKVHETEFDAMMPSYQGPSLLGGWNWNPCG